MNDGWPGHQTSLASCEPIVNEIDDENFTISTEANPTLQGFSIVDKKDVKLLPTNLSLVFSDLLGYKVVNCSVTKVHREHFQSLSKLRFLYLHENHIDSIDEDAFVDLVSLESLILGSNRISFLASNTFASQKSLKKLSLDDNQIQSLHLTTFHSLLNLEQLSLQFNEFSTLDVKYFENLLELAYVNLAYNNYDTIPENLFKNNLKLLKIYLDLNKISYINANMFAHLPILEYVNIEGTSWHTRNSRILKWFQYEAGKNAANIKTKQNKRNTKLNKNFRRFCTKTGAFNSF